MRDSIRSEQEEDDETTNTWKREIEDTRKKIRKEDRENDTRIPPPEQPERDQASL